jgi:hypothetical protein
MLNPVLFSLIRIFVPSIASVSSASLSSSKLMAKRMHDHIINPFGLRRGLKAYFHGHTVEIRPPPF